MGGEIVVRVGKIDLLLKDEAQVVVEGPDESEEQLIRELSKIAKFKTKTYFCG